MYTEGRRLRGSAELTEAEDLSKVAFLKGSKEEEKGMAGFLSAPGPGKTAVELPVCLAKEQLGGRIRLREPLFSGDEIYIRLNEPLRLRLNPDFTVQPHYGNHNQETRCSANEPGLLRAVFESGSAYKIDGVYVLAPGARLLVDGYVIQGDRRVRFSEIPVEMQGAVPFTRKNQAFAESQDLPIAA